MTLRKLVEDARRAGGDKEKTRVAHERAYPFMSAMAGDMPGFEEATRANETIECFGLVPCDIFCLV